MKTLGALAAIVALSACSSSANPPASALETVSAPRALANVIFTIVIPPVTSSNSSQRRARYVSPGTQSVVATLTAKNGTATTPQPYAVNVNYTSQCAPSAPAAILRAPKSQRTPQAVGAHCTFTIPAYPGLDTFSVVTYDAAQTSPTPASPVGNMLSRGTTTTTVVANAANSATVALGGVVASITLMPALAHPATGTSESISLQVLPKDADGDYIQGSTPLATPITLSDADTSGTTTLSTTTVTSPQTNVHIAYTGAPISTTFSASATNATTATTSFVSTISRMYVAGQTPNEVKAFSPSGSLLYTITSGVSAPRGLAVDASGKLYVSNNGNFAAGGGSMTTFIATLVGATQSSPTITGLTTPYGIAVDAAGKIYIASRTPDTVTTYTPSGIATSPTITGLNYPTAVAVDAAGKIYVANEGNNSDLVTFDSSGSPVSPTATTPITAGVDEPFGVTVDGSGKIYMANCCSFSGAGSVSSYLPDGTPATTITTSMANPQSVVVDPMGNIYVANRDSENITIYNSTGTLTATIPTSFNSTTVAVY